jgi:hypothetical protein
MVRVGATVRVGAMVRVGATVRVGVGAGGGAYTANIVKWLTGALTV